MNIQDLGALGELIAAIATVATLGYLAIQIRQNSDSIRMSAGIDLAQQVVDWHSRVTAQPELYRIWDEAADDPASLSPGDRRRFTWLVAEAFFIYEGQYQFFKKSYIAPEIWQPKIDSIMGLLKNLVIEEWWDSRQGAFSDEFFDYVESIRSQPVSWEHQNIGNTKSK